jgi:hypothetical protein
LVRCVSRSLVLGRRDGENARSTKIADWEYHRDREHNRTKASYKTSTIWRWRLPRAWLRHDHPPSGDGGYRESCRAMNLHHQAMVATKSLVTP